jgi:hypothetical protein
MRVFWTRRIAKTAFAGKHSRRIRAAADEEIACTRKHE